MVVCGGGRAAEPGPIPGGRSDGAQARGQLRTAGGPGGLRRPLPDHPRTAGPGPARTGAVHLRPRPVAGPAPGRPLPRGGARLRLRAGDGGVHGLPGGARRRQGHRELRDRRSHLRALRRAAGGQPMNGAQALIRTLVDAGVDVCFANPGTSEMHFVAALDDVPDMRAVLTLFEGVATGAADGYARMAGRPAATLLHLGPGMGNGVANLHNARRARTPVVNVVGDHARSHKRLDAPLESDIDAVAGTFSTWVRRTLTPADVGADAADAVAAARAAPGGIATLILPADVSWSDGAEVAAPRPVRPAPRVAPSVVEAVAAVLASGEPAVLFLGGDALTEDGPLAAGQGGRGAGAAP